MFQPAVVAYLLARFKGVANLIAPAAFLYSFYSLHDLS